MKVFISSMISDFESCRSAARSAILALRHEAVMAEEFGARPESPQIACLQGVRSSDLVVLILGERYGTVQGTSGVSPTHEEFNEAKGRKPILMFVQEGVECEPEQATFIAEVQGWQQGHFRAGFKTADELRDLVTRAISDYQLANTVHPLDGPAMIAAAVAMLPDKRRQYHSVESPMLVVALAAGPSQRLLRPAELESDSLADALQQEAMFGQHRLFDKSKGVDARIEGSSLVVQQERGALLKLDECGSLLVRLPLTRASRVSNRDFGGMPAILEEDVVRELSAAIAFADWTLERIDPLYRLTHAALAVSIQAAEHLEWRTKAEQDANPNSGTMRMGGHSEEAPIYVDRPRAALKFDAQHLAEDLMVPLRRQWKRGY